MKLIVMIKTLLGFAPNCEKVNAFLADYMDGTLPEKTAKQFEYFSLYTSRLYIATH